MKPRTIHWFTEYEVEKLETNTEPPNDSHGFLMFEKEVDEGIDHQQNSNWISEFEVETLGDVTSPACSSSIENISPRTQFQSYQPRFILCPSIYDRNICWQNLLRTEQEEMRKLTELSVLTNCTFSPKINRHLDAKQQTASPKPKPSRFVVQSQLCEFRCAKPPPKRVQKPISDSECTFQPVVNKAPKSPYLSENPFERLSRTVVKEPENKTVDTAVMKRPQRSSVERERHWRMFLERVQAMEAKRAISKDRIKSSEQAKMRASPRINRYPSSRARTPPARIVPSAPIDLDPSFGVELHTKLAEPPIRDGRSRWSPASKDDPLQRFMQRLLEDNECRQQKMTTKLSSEIQEAMACSFHPWITREGRHHRSRSAHQLCYGDSLRSTMIRKRKQTERDAAAAQECTFSPALCRTQTAICAKPKLPVRLHPELYSAWVKAYEQRKNEKLQRLAKRKEHEEKRECCFHPSVHGVPEFIQAIAESMSYIRPKCTPQKQCDHTFGYV